MGGSTLAAGFMRRPYHDRTMHHVTSSITPSSHVRTLSAARIQLSGNEAIVLDTAAEGYFCHEFDT